MKDWIIKQIKTYRNREKKAWEKGEKDMHAFYHGAEEAYIEMLKKLLDEENEE